MSDSKQDDEKLTEAELKTYVERVAWEIIPSLAEALIREELAKQLAD